MQPSLTTYLAEKLNDKNFNRYQAIAMLIYFTLAISFIVISVLSSPPPPSSSSGLLQA